MRTLISGRGNLMLVLSPRFVAAAGPVWHTKESWMTSHCCVVRPAEDLPAGTTAQSNSNPASTPAVCINASAADLISDPLYTQAGCCVADAHAEI
jgi:hypothetical protein